MTILELRRLITAGLSAYMGVPVCLSDQVSPELEAPFIIYSVTSPYIPESGLGEYRQAEGQDGRSVEIRSEQPTCTFSFTACSMNRETDVGYVLGDDEALSLTEKAQGWFLHAGYDCLSGKGATVVDTSNVQERSFLQVDEEARRYGFDVTLRYVRNDVRDIGAIASAAAIEKGERISNE